MAPIPARYPSTLRRIGAVWYRHYRVYTRTLITNAFPPFLEPLLFIAAMGFTLSRFLGTQTLDGLPFMDFLATGLMLMSSVFTSAFECTYGTFIRLNFDKTYDSMLAAPLLPRDIILGEILFASTKGAVYSSAVLCVLSIAGLVGTTGSLLTPFVGFFTAMLFAVASLLVTSFVHYNLDHFNFYFTGVLTPILYFCGTLFPVSSLPAPLGAIAEILPLTHLVRLERAVCFGGWGSEHLLGFVYCVVFIVVIGWIALCRFERRLID